MAEPLIVKFPAETVKVIEQLSKYLNLDRMEVISRGLGLLQLWCEADKKRHKIVERPEGVETASNEYEIDIAH